MTLDLVTVSLLTAVVVTVTAVIYIVQVLLRNEDGAGRLWALAFIAGLLTTLSYLVWATGLDPWWAIAVGNGAFTASAGFMWLGCRRFNGRPMVLGSAIVGAASLAAVIATIVPGPTGGDWAGAEIMFVSIFAFAAAGSAESFMGDMGRNRIAWGLGFVLGIQAIYYALRSVVYGFFGPESELFIGWLDTVPTSFMTITLSITACVVTSVLLADRARLTASSVTAGLALSDDDVLPGVSFAHVLLDMCGRARRRSDLVGVISLRIDDLPSISTAFGTEAANAVADGFRTVVRRFAPTSAFVGQDDATGLLVGIQPNSTADARRTASRIRRGLFDELSGVVGAVIPVVGVGVALSDDVGYEPAVLTRAARDAARDAAQNREASVVIARGTADQRVKR